MSTRPEMAQAALASAASPLQPTSVSVRMYRALEDDIAPETPNKRKYKGLLGDCFLIRLTAGDKTSHILIDCGLLLGSPDSVDRAKLIAESIADTCKGSLDLLVVTHEHWDHISGFSQAEKIFFDKGKLRIENLWMAWTEDPQDPDANALRAKFEKSGQAFAKIADRVRTEKIPGLDAKRLEEPGSALGGLEGFLGVSEKGTGKLAGRDVMDKLKAGSIAPPSFLGPVKADRSLAPDNVQATPGDVSLPVYVLGPPRDWKFLSKDKPSTNPEKQETYLDSPSLGKALLGFSEGDDVLAKAESPFAPQYCRRSLTAFTSTDAAHAPPNDAPTDWLIERYFQPDFGHEGVVADLPEGDKKTTAIAKRQAIADRRRIDGDWLAAAGALALKLDSDTNNTSLVLAFELPDDTVMLFAADAQVGNWLSWHNQTYGKDTAGLDRTAASILNRVRFYKVGHHGSHNATLDKLGLALMTRPDLVAAIPTDEELGARQGSGGWKMPNQRVRDALLKHTSGRMLRSDRWYFPNHPEKRPNELKDVAPDFFEKISEDSLFLEYRIY